MRFYSVCIAALAVIFSCSSFLPVKAQETDTNKQQIQQQIQKYLTAFNSGNTAEIAALWRSDGEYVNLSLQSTQRGRDQIVDELEIFLKANPGTQLSGEIGDIKPISKDVIQVRGGTRLVYTNGEIEAGSFTALFVSVEGKWLIESITETNQPQTSSREELKALEWLIGAWKDDVEDVSVTTTCNWSKSNQFLIRSFVVETEAGISQGSQVIGWDPVLRQIRSWSFFEDGSFGSAFWTRNGDSWIIKGVHTLTDGSVDETIATLSEITQSSMVYQLTSHSLNGELQPSRDPVRVKRLAGPSEADNSGGTEE